MDSSVNAHVKQNNVITEWVWFTGSTALLEGQGVCYDFDYGTASAADARRTNYVELPSITNARYFAGVAARAYAACTGGQFIEIYKPGSTCNILSKASTTLGSGLLTCEAGGTYAGYFRYAGFEGEGSCVPLQTVDRSSTAGNCLAKLLTGIPSGLVEVVTPEAGAITCMVGGITFFAAATLGSDATFTLADGTISGQRKGFSLLGAQTTNNIVITVTSGVQSDGSDTALATWTADTAKEEAFLVWLGESTDGVWKEEVIIGGTIA